MARQRSIDERGQKEEEKEAEVQREEEEKRRALEARKAERKAAIEARKAEKEKRLEGERLAQEQKIAERKAKKEEALRQQEEARIANLKEKEERKKEGETKKEALKQEKEAKRLARKQKLEKKKLARQEAKQEGTEELIIEGLGPITRVEEEIQVRKKEEEEKKALEAKKAERAAKKAKKQRKLEEKRKKRKAKKELKRQEREKMKTEKRAVPLLAFLGKQRKSPEDASAELLAKSEQKPPEQKKAIIDPGRKSRDEIWKEIYRQARKKELWEGKKRESFLKKLETKREEQKKERALNKEKADIFFKRGLEHYRAGRISLAVKLWERAFKLDPQNKDIWKRLRKARKKLKKKS